MWKEIIGYSATIFLVISCACKGKVLRFFSIVASSLFIVYGITIQAYPTAIANIFCFFLHIFYFFGLDEKIKKYRESKKTAKKDEK